MTELSTDRSAELELMPFLMKIAEAEDAEFWASVELTSSMLVTAEPVLEVLYVPPPLAAEFPLRTQPMTIGLTSASPVLALLKIAPPEPSA